MWLLFPNALGLEMRRTNLRRSGLSGSGAIQQYSRTKGTDVYYIPELLDRFRIFSVQQQALTDHRHALEVQRLRDAMAAAPDEKDKKILDATIHENLESRLEAQNAYLQMLNFVNTVKAVATGSNTAARTCAEITCGQYAVCNQGETGAKCQCEEGFEGNGFECFAPHHFTAVALIEPAAGKKPNIKELHLAVFDQIRLAVAYRDAAQGNKGYVMVGRAGLAIVRWGKPELFSGKEKAYGPIVAGLGTNSLLIGYRDSEKEGSAFVVSGILTTTDQYKVKLSKPEVFARNQAEKMTILQFPANQAALMYSEQVVDAEGNVLEAFGGACLAKVGLPEDMSKADFEVPKPSILGKYRFSDIESTRLSATLLTDTTFVVAYRGVPQTQGGAKPPYKEASVVWGQVKDGELAFSPNSVSLEPDIPQIWQRSVSVVSSTMFAYAYYCGTSREIRQTILKIDPTTHEMVITDGPRRLAEGISNYIGSINAPFAPDSPQSYTFFEKPGEKVGTAEICRVSQLGHMQGCRERPFAGYDIASSAVSGQLLWDGRLIFAFATKTGEPMYQVEALFAGHEPEAAHTSPPKPPSSDDSAATPAMIQQRFFEQPHREDSNKAFGPLPPLISHAKQNQTLNFVEELTESSSKPRTDDDW